MRDESDNFWVNPETAAQPPVAFTGLKLGSPKTVAVGLPAVLSSAKYVFGAMNVVRGAASSVERFSVQNASFHARMKLSSSVEARPGMAIGVST